MRNLGPFQGISLPKDWPQHVKLAVIHSVALAHRAITYSRSFAINSSIERVRLAGELDGVQNENALLEEEIRIKDARMATIPPRKRPQYAPQENGHPGTQSRPCLESRRNGQNLHGRT